MRLFKKKKIDTTIGRLILAYIQSQLPDRVLAFEVVTNNEVSTIIVSLKVNGMPFELDFDDIPDIQELSDVDKHHLIKTVVIPALRQLDIDLFAAHTEIERKIKELS